MKPKRNLLYVYLHHVTHAEGTTKTYKLMRNGFNKLILNVVLKRSQQNSLCLLVKLDMQTCKTRFNKY